MVKVENVCGGRHGSEKKVVLKVGDGETPLIGFINTISFLFFFIVL